MSSVKIIAPRPEIMLFSGETGQAGPRGPEGPRGMEGTRGPEGPRGIQGVRGPTGPIGPTGTFDGGIGVMDKCTLRTLGTDIDPAIKFLSSNSGFISKIGGDLDTIIGGISMISCRSTGTIIKSHIDGGNTLSLEGKTNVSPDLNQANKIVLKNNGHNTINLEGNSSTSCGIIHMSNTNFGFTLGMDPTGNFCFGNYTNGFPNRTSGFYVDQAMGVKINNLSVDTLKVGNILDSASIPLHTTFETGARILINNSYLPVGGLTKGIVNRYGRHVTIQYDSVEFTVTTPVSSIQIETSPYFRLPLTIGSHALPEDISTVGGRSLPPLTVLTSSGSYININNVRIINLNQEDTDEIIIEAIPDTPLSTGTIVLHGPTFNWIARDVAL